MILATFTRLGFVHTFMINVVIKGHIKLFFYFQILSNQIKQSVTNMVFFGGGGAFRRQMGNPTYGKPRKMAIVTQS